MPSLQRKWVVALQVAAGLMAATRGWGGEPEQPVLTWEKTLVPRVLVVRGLWGECFRTAEACDKAGMRHDGNLLSLTNASSPYSVVVLVNKQADHLGAGLMECLRRFVDNGGGLVVLGGFAAYGSGAYAGTPLESLLPVPLAGTEAGYGAQAVEGARLTVPAGVDWPIGVSFDDKPVAYYFHRLVPRNGARVQLKVGDQAAMVSGTHGKGRVVACALMVNGDPPAGAVPFWEWPEWPTVLGQALTWAAGARPTGTNGAIRASASLSEPLTEKEIAAAELGMDTLPPGFVQRALAHPNARIAGVLFDLASVTDGKPKCSLAVVGDAVRPYARVEWGARLATLADATTPDKDVRKAALTLLGASRAPMAYGVLVTALADPGMALAAMDGLAELGNAEAVPLLKSEYEVALKPAVLADAPGRWAAAAFAEACLPVTHAAVALYRLGDPDGVSRLMALARDVKLYQRVFANATKRRVQATDAQGMAGLKLLRAGVDNLNQAWNDLAASVGPIPSSQQDRFAAYAQNAEDPVEIGLIADAIEKTAGQLKPVTLRTLATSKNGVLCRIGRALEGKD